MPTAAITDIRDFITVTYDRRFNAGSISANVAHQIAKETKPQAKVKRRTMVECMALLQCETLKDTKWFQLGSWFHIDSPKLQSSHMSRANATAFYSALLEMQAEIIKGMSDEAIAELSAKYKGDFQ